MRYAILADIHANMAAFKAVLNDIEKEGEADELWCLGDVVGYGPDPHQCIQLLRLSNHICVAGNHDLAAIGKLDVSYFNSDAATACQWTAQHLTPEDADYLEKLPRVIEKDDFTIVHGSPREPILEYVLSLGTARESFKHFKSKYCLVGHTHAPLVFKHDGKSDMPTSFRFTPGVSLMLGESRFVVNPGSVGQPRDGDPRASYAIYDSETKEINLYRVAYDVNATQTKMARLGLPMSLVVRLSRGM